MKLLHACPPSCKRLRIDADTAGAAEERLRALELIDRMVAKGMRRGDALRTVGLAKSTYYDWRRAFRRGGARALKPSSARPRTVRRRQWKDADDRAVLKLRRDHPYMGKAKLQAMLARDGVRLSVSTVGRILSRAIADGRIKPASLCEGRTKPKRRRSFDGAWASRWKCGDRARPPGEMLQIDHMTYSRDGRALKEVPADSSSPAVCPVTRFMAARVFSRATAGRTPRAKARALPRSGARGHAVPRRLHPGRRRQRVHGRLRAHLRGDGHPPARPAAAKAPVETSARPRAGRRARQPVRPDRVPEPLRRPPHRRRRRPKACPARVPPQLPAPALGAGLPDVERVPCRDRGCCLIQRAKSSERS